MRISRHLLLLILAAVLILAVVGAKKYIWYPIENKNAPGDLIVALGDSLTYGTGAGRGEDWPAIVADRCGCEIINKGVPGETTADALRRLEADVLALEPRIVVVGLGGNDVLQRLPRDQTFENLRQIVKQIQQSGAMVVILGLNGFPLSDDLSSGYKKLARETGSVYVANILGGILTNPKLKSDQIHPNAAGYAVMADRIYEKLEPHL
jgi:lysophospholipase L1-like esterase